MQYACKAKHRSYVEKKQILIFRTMMTVLNDVLKEPVMIVCITRIIHPGDSNPHPLLARTLTPGVLATMLYTRNYNTSWQLVSGGGGGPFSNRYTLYNPYLYMYNYCGDIRLILRMRIDDLSDFRRVRRGGGRELSEEKAR